MSSLSSYSSIFAIGHRAIKDILSSDVVVEEKIDGSQFSFMRATDGQLRIRSKSATIDPDNPPKMFARAVDAVKGLDLLPGVVYRGEVLDKPKHNVLAYDRAPTGNVILFDVDADGLQNYYAPAAKREEAERIGLEVVPTLFVGRLHSPADVHDFMTRTSCLGGATIEGVVIKNYQLFGQDKKVMMAKYVREAFKEMHREHYKNSFHGEKGDIVAQLVAQLKLTARWEKAIIHLRELDLITDSPQDIGPLMKEIHTDTLKECEEELRDQLFKWFWARGRKEITKGFAEWYKNRLLENAFAPEPAERSEVGEERESYAS